MTSTQAPAQLEHVLQQLVNNLADLHKVLSDQQKPCHTENEQVTALDAPEPGNEAEGLTTTPPLETATAFCAASPTDPNRSDEDAPVGDLTGARSDVAEDAVVSEPPQADAFVRLPRNLDEWIVSPLPNGIRLKVFQASGTKWLQDHPLFGLMTLKLDLKKAGASRSILEEYTEDPIHMGFWTQYLESVYANYTYYVRTKFQLVDIPALEGLDARALYVCGTIKFRGRVLLRKPNWETLALEPNCLFNTLIDRGETSLGKVWELGSIFGPQHLADASDTDSTQQQFRQTGPIASVADIIGGLGYTVTDHLFFLLRRLNSIPLAKYSTLQRTQTTVKEKWKDLMSDGRRSTVLERRSTVVTTLNEISPHSKYTIVILSDDKVEQKSSSDALDRLLSSCDGIGEPARPSGISHHLLLVNTTMSTWEQYWHEILDVIEVETSIQMHEIQDTQRLDELMFDRSFKLSKKYFSLLQFLKIASKSVEEPASNFGASHRHFLEIVASAAQNIHDEEWDGVKDRWNHVATSVGEATRRIQDRIEHLIEEVKTHQESMFNATSLRETNNGMALNRSVYVLTAVTILYAPVGFMAQDTKVVLKTFWALPFLNSPAEDGQTKVPHGFRTSFITVPLLTYFFSVFVSLFFGSSRFRKITSQVAQGYWAYYSEFFGPLKYGRDILLKYTEPFRLALELGLKTSRGRGKPETGRS
ncbi:hypothetical protein CH63R_03875 [Colletotrichum higginsianum IMI 349063]|uniref:Uncharacterized protein n=1 Tax=Colletotrichum higginsianum (strain IMI 349063) TaxID=759273 RepID=A0A1B7YHM6_COLHI|nr:hypothetical protein CH63R_03875 [Colletotrichum higginsianum IMI 349063]OBR11579.1 hypothetical protein CH63R_03875 [Colletotrichum higginsianum IMI 349063]